MSQPESKLSRAILTALRKEGVFCFKFHGGPLTMVGVPDIIACVDGRFVGIETKMPAKRKNVSPAQRRIHELIVQAGGVAVVVCGVREALGIVHELRIAPGAPPVRAIIQEDTAS
jgi:Holliday junction resolvase